MRMRQETFKKSYYIPAFGKSIEIRRNQDIDKDGILGKELLAQYGEDCILEGETKSLMEKVASGDIGGTSLTTEQTAAIEKIEGLEASASEIDKYIDTPPNLVPFIYGIRNPIRHMKVLINSDSTGDEVNEWAYLWGQWLAENTDFNINFRFWNDTLKQYDSSISLSTGKTYNLDIFNFAKGGSEPIYILNGDNATNGYKNITESNIYPNSYSNLDLIIMNHGHNINAANLGDKGVGLFIAQVTEELLSYYPSSAMLVLKQNPNKTLENQNRTRQIADFATRRGFAVADVWEKFIKAGLSDDLYKTGDSIHPSELGSSLFLESVTELMDKSINFNNASFSTSLMNNKGINYLNNGTFSTWTDLNLPPTRFDVTNGTVSKDTTKYDSKKGYSLKVTATTTACNFGMGTLSSGFEHLKGKNLTLAVRMFVDAPITSSYGSVGITNNTQTTVPSTQPNSNGSWVWRFHTVKILKSESVLRIKVYLNGLAGVSINIDRMILCLGDMPYDSDE